MGRFILVSLGLLVMALSIRGAQNPCLKEWYFRNQRCYKVFKEEKTWDDAEAFCAKQKAGCHLASIHTSIQTADTADYVAENLKSGQCVWIGLHDPKQNDEWVWINRHETNYIRWADGYPDHSKKEKKFCAKLEKET
ncbi:C-type lectin mannose-binding isoform-like, partial [Pseudonaja textilis]|uniref:C-type lectin mannose-binding isoform-like n=1 Tax=Pseudonaja textilis TaxID=8673 RepID=UPI000EAA4EEB